MPPVPKKKIPRSYRGHRRAHQKLRAPKLVSCPNCGEMRPPHQVCPHCGYYKGREVIRVERSS